MRDRRIILCWATTEADARDLAVKRSTENPNRKVHVIHNQHRQDRQLPPYGVVYEYGHAYWIKYLGSYLKGRKTDHAQA